MPETTTLIEPTQRHATEQAQQPVPSAADQARENARQRIETVAQVLHRQEIDATGDPHSWHPWEYAGTNQIRLRRQAAEIMEALDRLAGPVPS